MIYDTNRVLINYLATGEAPTGTYAIVEIHTNATTWQITTSHLLPGTDNQYTIGKSFARYHDWTAFFVGLAIQIVIMLICVVILNRRLYKLENQQTNQTKESK